MMIRYLVQTALAIGLLGCSQSDPDTIAPDARTTPSGAAEMTSATVASSNSGAGAAPPVMNMQSSSGTSSLILPPLDAGYQRMLPPPVPVPSGVNGDWIQWVSEPLDQDYDVISIKGKQSVGGHHATLTSITEQNPVGFTRVFSERDQLISNSLGGIGAEGNVAIPEGLVFRVKKGRSLAIQVHYLNSTEKEVQAQTYIDVQMTPRNESHVVAGHFNNATLKFSLPPKTQTEIDILCDVGEDLPVLRTTNHMHDMGVSALTEYTDPAGVTHMLKRDDKWSYDWALMPNYTFYPKEMPLVIPKGSRVRTHCVWNNTKDKALAFPEEMCAFATVILGEREINCIDNVFSVNTSESAVDPSAGSAAPAPPAAGAAVPVAGAAGSAAATSSGACTGSADRSIVEGAEFETTARTCGGMCIGSPESCVTDCLTQNTTLTAACASCQGGRLSCAMANCIGDCSAGMASASCQACLDTHCDTAYDACSGL